MPLTCVVAVVAAAATAVLQPPSTVWRSDLGCSGLLRMMVESRLTAYQEMVGQATRAATGGVFDEGRMRRNRLLLPLAAPVDAADMRNRSQPTLLIVFLGHLDIADCAWAHLESGPRPVRLVGNEADQADLGLVGSIARSRVCSRDL